jgi:streptogramin lyase
VAWTSLGEFALEPFAQVEILRLEELRAEAREELVEAHLELGHHGRLVSELEAFVAEEPLRERLRGQLMLALYRSGRQAEALEVYRQGRNLLAEELGLEPGEALKGLERAILGQEPTLSGAVPPRPVAGSATSEVPDRAKLRKRSLRRRLALVAGSALVLAVAAVALAVALTRDSHDRVTVVANSIAIVDAETNRVVGDVAVGRRPVAVAIDEDAVWVASAGDGTVSRIDPKTREVIDATRVGTDMRDIAVGFGSVWVADGKDSTLTRINPAQNELTRVPLGKGRGIGLPVSFVAIGAGAVWATRGNTLLEIDPQSNQVVTTTPISPPTGLAAGLGAAWIVTDDRRLLRIAPGTNVGSKAVVHVILTDEALAPTVGAGSVWLIVYKDTGEIWRVDPESGAVNIIQRTGRYPLDLAVADGSEDVWAVDLTGAVIRINPNIGLGIARIRTAPARRSAIAVGAGAVWIAVQE